MNGDAELIQIVDAAMAEAVRRSGSWLLCRPGCHDCCIGPFPITVLDAQRLRSGLEELRQTDPARARRVSERAQASVERILREFPGDPLRAVLELDGAAEDELCPALNPATGTCDLYAARPITCRIFGPPVRFGGNSLAVCDLCFRGASEAEVAACEVTIDPGSVEARFLAELETDSGAGTETIVAFALTAAS